MTLYELHALIADNRALISETWNFFISIHMAILGGLFLSKGARLHAYLQAALCVVYLGFMYINYSAQLDNYTYVQQLIEEARKSESETFRVMMNTFEDGWTANFLLQIYLTVAFFGCSVIVVAFNRSGTSKEQ